MLKTLTGLFVLVSLCIINSCSSNQDAQMTEKKLFGKLPDGREVFLYTLKNGSGTEARIINYGAILTNLFVKDKNGKAEDIVLGYDSLQGYIDDNAYFGSIVGRFGNRIGKGKFTLDGKEYQLPLNDGPNHLHGGPGGFNKVLWDAEPASDGKSIKLTYVSKNGEEGYPGTFTIKVSYTLTDNNELEIKYEGTTDKVTIANPTHHSYFNLSGNMNSPILDNELFIDADSITPVDSTLIPTGEIRPVKDTPMDFSKPVIIGTHVNDEYDQLKYGRGFDHNWVLNNYKAGEIRKIASVYHKESGRYMEVFSDQPGVQFYCGNFLNGSLKGKSGISYQLRTGLCLEAQHFPDSPNHPEFPSVTLKHGEVYNQTTIYKFSTK
jgi:aldose 1-epimerase